MTLPFRGVRLRQRTPSVPCCEPPPAPWSPHLARIWSGHGGVA
jgi:hypothetical protein